MKADFLVFMVLWFLRFAQPRKPLKFEILLVLLGVLYL